MKSAGDGRLLLLGAAASVGAHAMLGAGLWAMPDPPGVQGRGTTIEVQALPTMSAPGVAQARVLQPSSTVRPVAERARDSMRREPAELSRKTLAAADASGRMAPSTKESVSIARKSAAVPLAPSARQASRPLEAVEGIGRAAASGAAPAPAASPGDTATRVVTPSTASTSGEVASSTPPPVAAGMAAAPRRIAESGTIAATAAQPAASTPAESKRAASASATASRVAIAAPTASASRIVSSPSSSGTTASPSAGDGEEMALIAPRIPERETPPRKEIDPFASMLDVIAAHEAGDCFLALAPAKPELAIDGFAAVTGEIEQLRSEIARRVGVPVEARSHEVSEEQCRALSFARALSARPIPALAIEPDMRVVPSGGILSGHVGNFGRKWVYLLLVDDEGKVEEVQDLFREANGAIGFRAPVTLEDGPVETVQILLALASDSPLETVASHDKKHAAAYFPALATEIRRGGRPVDFGLTFFSVR
ncbi:hypothetical protein [Chelativorans sp. AA-79]|uniref:hypothetical protein n=1 Tax=Chelativorans sp. AA-79 TaxID=3028735 RepID=UPI0023F76886|nr:hypothetical protein [Chelativorans sp. AA-79]WEX10858.1 hypothetical protein PVE73_07965 [Chelativorans sp. AA-79]